MSAARVSLSRTTFENIQNWKTASLDLSLAAFKRSAEEIIASARGFRRSSEFSGIREDWLAACRAALTTNQARSFFEEFFIPFKILDPMRPEGLFTGYYEPIARGSRTKSDQFHVPIYMRPPELVAFPADIEDRLGMRYGQYLGGIPSSFFTRQQIEMGALEGRQLEICWLENWVDAFFVHVQGSARIELDDGKILRLAFAAKNGQPYTSIGAALLAQGHGSAETMSMQVLREWMQQNPEGARLLMWQNKSFIFFREIEVLNQSLGALGAAQVNLTPLCSLAIDRHYWMFGTPFWLETMTPPEAPGGPSPYLNLMIGQDTGTAIRGALRGDVYWGWGETAIVNAGHMKSQGQMTVLLPHSVSARLGL